MVLTRRGDPVAAHPEYLSAGTRTLRGHPGAAEPGDDPLFFEALGSALVAAESPGHRKVPALSQLLRPPAETKLERLPPLAASLNRVHRLPRLPAPGINGDPFDLILGFDIGSTGSKVVALNAASQAVIWEGYRRTGGDPVGAAQALAAAVRGESPRRAAACAPSASPAAAGKSSARCMATCYGAASVFILNEIAAHAEGALHFDRRVDTIFEIGGQDAKYIRLADGRVIDCAMNEACSAGTGSFIEEQGRKFSGIEDVQQLGESRARRSVGRVAGAALLGLHGGDHRRERGERGASGCHHGGPLRFDRAELSAPGQRQPLGGSGYFLPGHAVCLGRAGGGGGAPNGQRGHRSAQSRHGGGSGDRAANAARSRLGPAATLDLSRFLEARLEQKDTFVCKSTVGCGGGGNNCRIDQIKTRVASQRQNFTWGGGCSLYDKGTRRKKLPNRAPDPFREREALTQEIIRPYVPTRGRRPSPWPMSSC